MANPAEPIDVTAIIVTRNEEPNIVEVLQAVLQSFEFARATGTLRSGEVILVDSASTDRTVDLASQFPIRIVRLRRQWPLSASAGRATGARLARGKLLLFVDGDYILDPRWLPEGLQTIWEPFVAGVCGVELEDIKGRTILARKWSESQARPVHETVEVDAMPVGLVRRDAHDQAGGFHPFLHGGEDRDFAFRVRARGWKFLRIPRVMGVHRLAPADSPITYIEYFRSVAVWSFGDGQVCRARWGDAKQRREFLRRYATARYLIHDAQFIAATVLLLLNLMTVFLGGLLAIGGVLVDISVVLALWAWGRGRWTWRERLYELQGIVYGPLRQVLFGLGLVRPLPDPGLYPHDVEIVKDATPRQRSGL